PVLQRRPALRLLTQRRLTQRPLLRSPLPDRRAQGRLPQDRLPPHPPPALLQPPTPPFLADACSPAPWRADWPRSGM
ncbi:MAG TPA: hypothetical protein VIR28_17670, partial [Achromobacter sp.]|uniref:hypothetical protein n=1 Tax=Achromobacter sp. TaxID=134375 RepID=UPI002F92C58E